MFAQQAVRLDDEDKYQHGKNHSIGKLGGNISLGKDFYDTQKDTAQHSPGNGADTAEDSSGKSLDARHGACGGHKGGVSGT